MMNEKFIETAKRSWYRVPRLLAGYSSYVGAKRGSRKNFVLVVQTTCGQIFSQRLKKHTGRSIPCPLTLQEASEAYLVGLFEDTNLCAIHANQCSASSALWRR